MFDTILDRNARSVENDRVVGGIFPIGSEQPLHGATVPGVAALDFGASDCWIANSLSSHQYVNAELQGGADAHTHHMRNGAQQVGGAPSPDQHIAVCRELQYFCR